MFVNKHCIVLLYNAVMKAREEALSGIQAKMDEVAEEIRDCYFKLGNTIASSPESLGIPVGKRLLESVLNAKKDKEKSETALNEADRFLSSYKEKSDEADQLRDRIGEKNRELKLSRLRLGALVYEQCSLSLLDKSIFSSVYDDVEEERLYSEKKNAEGFIDRFFSLRGKAKLQRSTDSRLLGYASLVLDNDLSGALSGESAKSVYEECTACSSEIKELSARLSEISGYLDRSDSEKKALDKGGYEKLKADSDDKSDKLKEEIIGYGNYLFDRGASWIDQSTPSEILDYLDSILKSQNEYSALSNTLNRMMKEAKADDYKAQIEEEKARILILQKEKERIDLQISQIQAEIDRLEGTVDRLSMN